LTSRISNLITSLLSWLPAPLHAIILRKAVAISNDRVKFMNGQITMFGSIENLREAGFSPKGIVDVGANVGNWTRSVATLFPSSEIHMIEAQPELASDLKQTISDLGSRAT
jgi:hypothetical protein